MPKPLHYDESSIEVLEGLKAVQKRPGMYIGALDKKGMHHLLWEIIDNAVDEALAGFADTITVTLDNHNIAQVEDNGRGIPIKRHASGKATPIVIFTKLHAGGKFSNTSYKHAGGLHGVGAAVVNALSEKLAVTIRRDQKISTITFQKGKVVTTNLSKTTAKATGTKVIFQPAVSFFKQIKFDYKMVREYMKEISYLNNNLTLILIDKSKDKQETFCSQTGLQDFLTEITKEKAEAVSAFYCTAEESDIYMQIAFVYSNSDVENVFSFANSIKTTNHGRHVTGFYQGLRAAMHKYFLEVKLINTKTPFFNKKEFTMGLNAIVSVRIAENILQFEGQTKNKLGSIIVESAVKKIVSNQLYLWLQQNPKTAQFIFNKLTNTRKVLHKIKNIKKSNKSKNLSHLLLRGKLIAELKTNSPKSELFLVEGSSAGGTAKAGRDHVYQAILSLKGKIINTMKATESNVLKNQEIMNIIHALGTGYGANFDLAKLRYPKIIILTDADSDGSHIQLLLLAFFFKYMRPLVTNNHVYIANPPLYEVSLANHKVYAWNDEALQTITQKHKIKNIQRYKGLGEMDAEQLWETTMNPASRNIEQVSIDKLATVEKAFQIMMGSNIKERKIWIENNIVFE